MSDPSEPRPSRVSLLFDLRSLIAVLFGVYGVVCVIWGLAFDSAEDRARSGNVNINLWMGLAMLAVAAGFTTWVLLRPVDPEAPTEDS